MDNPGEVFLDGPCEARLGLPVGIYPSGFWLAAGGPGGVMVDFGLNDDES
jgi:hypothetical protein